VKALRREPHLINKLIQQIIVMAMDRRVTWQFLRPRRRLPPPPIPSDDE
jgi:hypothetical protein